jgi:phage baseplate assembly protein V
VVEIDDNLRTGPIRWAAPRMGQTRVWAPPAVGEQVLVLCPAGEIGAAIALGGIACDAFPVPGDSETPCPVRRRRHAVLRSASPCSGLRAARWRQAGPHRRSGRERHDHRAQA